MIQTEFRAVLGELNMKKLVLALTVVAAFSAPAIAADMAAKAPLRAAPPPAPVASWTGFWVSGGFGYGMAEYQHSENDFAAPFTLQSLGQDAAAKGWLFKIGLGYDYQFMGKFVVGAFADTDWSNISGQYGINTQDVSGSLISASHLTGQFKNDYSWAVGARVGYEALPGLLTYFNAGYTQAHFKGTNYIDSTDATAITATGISLGSQTRGGYFIGGGTEYALTLVPGLFWKSEVRFSELGNQTNPLVCTVAIGCGLGTVLNQTSHVFEQKATTELVYRFNWGGPVVAKY
jgi:outer membrane immunogenic protein